MKAALNRGAAEETGHGPAEREQAGGKCLDPAGGRAALKRGGFPPCKIRRGEETYE